MSEHDRGKAAYEADQLKQAQERHEAINETYRFLFGESPLHLIFMDTEGANPTRDGWSLREFGAVDFITRRTFHGIDSLQDTFERFWRWLNDLGLGRLVFVTDNIAYDWPPIHWHMVKYFGTNPFGHSARRIGDFYAGLVGDWRKGSEWKSLRVTPHDHNPVNDAMGNVEAFAAMLEGKRGKKRGRRYG